MQEIFFEHCIQSMINDMGKGKDQLFLQFIPIWGINSYENLILNNVFLCSGIPTYGYRIFVQVMARDRPDIVLSNLNKVCTPFYLYHFRIY